MKAIDELTAAEVKDLAGRMGVTPAKLRASFAARDLAERAMRIRRPMEMHRIAVEHLPRMARAVVNADDAGMTGAVAVALGLVGPDDPISAAKEALVQLSLVDELPARPSVSPNARANGRSGFGDTIYAILCEHGRASYNELCERIRETEYAPSVRGLKTALKSLVKSDAVRQMDGRGGPLYEVVRSAELQRD